MATESKKNHLLSSSPDLEGIQRSLNKHFYYTIGWQVKEDLTILNPKGEVYTELYVKKVVKKGVVQRYQLRTA